MLLITRKLTRRGARHECRSSLAIWIGRCLSQGRHSTDPLTRRVVEQTLVGVATRQYGRSLEPLSADVRTQGTSKSAVSRRFVAAFPLL